MKGSSDPVLLVLMLFAGVVFVGWFYMLFAEEPVTVEVSVEDQRFRDVDDQVVMITESTTERCDPIYAKDFAYVENGQTTFEFKKGKYAGESFEFCSPSRTGWMASASFEFDHLRSGVREFPTENLRFYVESVTVG